MNVFDIIGPIMIGPSSSHTAGAVRLGRVSWKILGFEAKKAQILFSGSFAQTYKGHGTDKAIIAGIMGMHSHDDRIKNSLEIAKQSGLDFSFEIGDIPDAHPNTAKITLTADNNTSCTVVGSSIGGGNILVTEINSLAVSFTGQYNTIIVLHYDKAGTIAAVTNFMAYSGLNIGNFRLARPKKGGEAVMTIEVDGEVPDYLIKNLQILPNIINVILIKAI